MIDKRAVGQFSFDLPEAPIKQRVAPADWQPFDDLPELSGVVAFDTETKDPGLGNKLGSSWARPGEGFVTGFSIAWKGGPSFYCPVQHAGGNGDAAKYWRWLRAQAAKPDVTFVCANTIYDIGWLLRYDIDVASPPIDVQGMAALLDESRSSYSLDSLMSSYLGRRKDDQDLRTRAREYGIHNPKLHMDRLPAWDVAPYAITDAEGTLALYDAMLPLIQEQKLERVLEMERECLLVGRDLRWRGVRIDEDHFAKLRVIFADKRDSSIELIKDKTGVNVSPWDNVAIAKALEVENPTLEMERTSRGVASIRSAVVEQLRTPVSSAIVQMRKMDKAISTFIDGYIGKFCHRGRIHAEFHPLRKTSDEDGGEGGTYGTVSGRWASSSPNLTNVPNRDEDVGPPIRRGFLPEEGERWLKLDWASQEPRLTVHFAHITKQRGAAEMVERFRQDPMTDLHGECAKLMGVSRKEAKTIGLAIAYGAGGAKIANQLGLPTKWITGRNGTPIEVAGDEAKRLLDLHAQNVPFIRGLSDMTKSVVDRRGYIVTVGGRRVRFRMGMDGEYMRSYKALNALIQGSAADQLKMAVAQMRREGIPISVIVHDEVDASIPCGEEGERRRRRMIEIMENVVQLSLPMIAEAKEGANWADAE